MLVHSLALVLLVCECEITKNIKAHSSFAAFFLQKRAFAAKTLSFGGVTVNIPLAPICFCSKWKKILAQ